VSLSTQVTGTLPIANGGTGQTGTPSNGQLLIGNGSGFTRATLSAGSGISISNGAGSISIASTSTGTVTSVSGTGTVNGITLSGTVTSSGSLTLGGGITSLTGTFLYGAYLYQPWLIGSFEGFGELGTGSGTRTINATSADYFYNTANGNSTFVFTNSAYYGYYTQKTFLLYLTNGGAYTMTWPANTKWAGGTAPTLTASGTDVLGFSVGINGTNITGFVVALDVKV
jgi:hypothetical protein